MNPEKINLSGAQFAGGFAETVRCMVINPLVINTGDTPTCAEVLNLLATDILEINKANGDDVTNPNDWTEDSKPNTDKLMRMIALIHSEASEGCEAIRKNNRENFTEELADVIIRCLSAAAGLELDIGQAVIAKLEKSSKRGYRHGGKLA